MDRSTGRSATPPSSRGGRDALVMVGLGVIMLFAIVGVVSAGIWIGGRVSNGSHSAAAPTAVPTRDATARFNLNRAHAQATRIVRTAQQTGRNIVGKETTRARRQAAAIIGAANRKAAATARAASKTSAPAPSVQPAGSASGVSAPSSTTSGTGTYGSATGSTAYGTTGTTGSASTGSTAYGSAGAGANSSSPGQSANLSKLPASWKVVAYNATFGAGPGSAGSITVTNRSRKRFHGAARVVYAHGGSATASFAGIAPGQTLVLPLNGPVYPGGGYTIQMTGLR